MRSLIVAPAALLAAALLTGCDAGSSPAAPDAPAISPDHARFVEPVQFDIENPCNGELITFSGEAATQANFDSSIEGPNLHAEFTSRLQASGVGSVTGATYTLTQVEHDGFNSPNVPAPQFTFTARSVTRVESQPSGSSFDIHFIVHATGTGSGDFKVTRDVEFATCHQG